MEKYKTTGAEQINQSIRNGIECTSCGDVSTNTITERILTEIIQKGMLNPSDFGRINDPDFPEEKKILLKMMLKN